MLGKGEHEIISTWTAPGGNHFRTTLGITRSNIMFVGTGIDTTTIEGGFGIHEQENITFKNLTVTKETVGRVRTVLILVIKRVANKKNDNKEDGFD